MKFSRQVSIAASFQPVARMSARLLLGALLASTAIAGPSISAPENTSKVTFHDLNLNTPAGAHALYRRIRNTAKSLCGLADATDELLRAQFANCTDHAVADAVRSLARPELTKIYVATLNPTAAARFQASQTTALASDIESTRENQ